MFIATKDKMLPTTVTGSLPRPLWYQANLQGRSFSAAMTDLMFREQYTDAVAAFVTDQMRAGLDILVDGDARADMDVGGRSWFSYLFERMEGFGPARLGAQPWSLDLEQAPGTILHEVMETRNPAYVTGPVGPGHLEYAALWKTAQRLTPKPLKFGGCCSHIVEVCAVNEYYKSRRELVLAIADALNAEYHALADAGCPVIQVEEPLLHQHGGVGADDLTLEFYVNAFNREVAGLRDKTELWVHTCWGNPAAQRMAEKDCSYRPSLPFLDQLDADVITFETAANGGAEIKYIADAISKDKKICIGVVNHRTLQVETPEEVAALIRLALEHIEPERLVLSTDCGFGRQGMSRIHAFYKMVSIARGANIVRCELGLDEVPVPAADPRFSLF